MRPGNIYLLLLAVLLPVASASAQQIRYGPPVDEKYLLRYEVTGRVADNYWVEKIFQKRGIKRTDDPWGRDKQIRFDIYDRRLRFITDFVPSEPPRETIRIYNLSGPSFFDRLFIVCAGGETSMYLSRYQDAADISFENKLIFQIPVPAEAASVLLLRSEDLSKMLLLVFESIPDKAPAIHALLFDDNWQLIRYRKLMDPSFSQPYIQYNYEEKPIEDFDNCPVKLLNQGAWLMLAPSRQNQNLLLFHFADTDTTAAVTEISLPHSSTTEDMVLATGNERNIVQIAILSRLGYRSIKNVKTLSYSLKSKSVLFDSSYAFSTTRTDYAKTENLVQEYLVAKSPGGFLLLKEYGRKYEQMDFNSNDPLKKPDRRIDTSVSIKPDWERQWLPINILPEQYIRTPNLLGFRDTYLRGDLAIYYFPAGPGDSCWSGLLSMPQQTELNNSYLSYLVLTVSNKLTILYNRYWERMGDAVASSTMLNEKGFEEKDKGMLFWRMSNVFNFQAARQIGSRLLALPYRRNARQGFAIIEF